MVNMVVQKGSIPEARVIHFESMTRIPFIKHFFTLSHDGFGKSGFGYLKQNGPEAEATFKALDLSGCRVAFTKQAHTDEIRIIETLDDVLNFNRSVTPFDGLMTQLSHVALWTVYADCTPVYVVDLKTRAIGIVHSGWRGTVKGIAPRLIRMMQTHYGTMLEDLAIVIGPSIGVEHFEVGPEVVDAFIETFGPIEGMIDYGYTKPHIHVRLAIEASLLKMGIEKQQIEVSDLCTYEDAKDFYSYRRQGQEAGRMAAVLMRTE